MTDEEKLKYTNSLCPTYIRADTCLQCEMGYYFDKENSSCLQCGTDAISCAYCDYKYPKR